MKLTHILAVLVLIIAMSASVFAAATYITATHNVTSEYPARIAVLFNFTAAGDSFSINDTTNWQINKTGYLQNITNLVPYSSVYNITIVANDSSNNTDTIQLWVNITDTTPPTIYTHNITLAYPTNVSVLFNFTDNYMTGNFTVNDTTRFKMNKTGFLFNITSLIPYATYYWINVTANDTARNNIRSSVIWINITDTTAPVLTVSNRTIEFGAPLSYQITGSDNYMINNFSVNETGNFSINSTGFMQNITAFANGTTYWVSVTANDTLNNSITVPFEIYVVPSINPTITTHSATLEFRNSSGLESTPLAYQFVYSDNVGIIKFGINDTGNFTINTTGFLQNNTILVNGTVYLLNITVNDTVNNTASVIITVNMTYSQKPTLTASNLSVAYGTRLTTQFAASDNVAVDWFSVNDTANFTINKTGYFQNNTRLIENVTYWVNITVNDTINNTFSVPISIAVTQPVPATTTTTASSGSGATSSTTTTSTATTVATTTTSIKQETTVSLNGLVANVPKTITVSDGGVSITELVVTAKVNIISSSINAKSITAAPSGVLPAGSVYKYIEITATNITSDNVSSVVISFHVEKSWLATNNLSGDSVRLNRFVGNSWVVLPTAKVSEDSTYFNYNATSPGFSVFAITASSSSSIPPIDPLVIGLIIVVIIVVVVLFIMKRQGKFSKDSFKLYARKSSKKKQSYSFKKAGF